MGLSAVRHEPVRQTRPRLKVVGSAKKRARAKSRVVAQPRGTTKSRPRVRADECTVARRVFRSFAVLVSVIAVMGFARVWLSVQAAEASRDSAALRRRITMERYRGDMLEVRVSALGSPSRIRAIADATMCMTPAAKITQIDITEQPTTVLSDGPANDGPVAGFVHQAMHIAAGEAQALLVGSVGLSSVR